MTRPRNVQAPVKEQPAASYPNNLKPKPAPKQAAQTQKTPYDPAFLKKYPGAENHTAERLFGVQIRNPKDSKKIARHPIHESSWNRLVESLEHYYNLK